MPAPILFDPGSRSLVTTGPADLGLFGAPPQTDFNFRPASAPADAVAAEPGYAPAQPLPGEAPMLTPPHPVLPPAFVLDQAGAPSQLLSLRPPELDHGPSTAASDSPSLPAPTPADPAGMPELATAGTAVPAGATSADGPATVLEGLGMPTAEVPVDALPPTLSGVQATIGAVEDQIDSIEGSIVDLLGSDPTGGIATLVSLVEVTDLLDLRGTGASDAAEVGGSALRLLDDLSSDLIFAEPLLDQTEVGDAQDDADTPLLSPLVPPLDLPGDDLLHGLI
ncbi:MAG TPA: hypothetical protein VMG08_19440 [Allosphingosinicella sp.]|nr:hypothetical protein [Allosphingosinicella sp.]